MIISHRHKFIYLKTRKTASTSIEISLSRYCGPDDVITPIAPADEATRRAMGLHPQNYQGRFNPMPELLSSGFDGRVRSIKDFVKNRRFYNHLWANKVRNRLGAATWNDYFKFTFERDPLEKTISHFYWKNRDEVVYPTIDAYLDAGDLSFNYPIYSIDDHLCVDFMGKHDRLKSDLSKALAQVGIQFDGWLPQAKSGQRKDKRPATEQLSVDQSARIRQLFAKEEAILSQAGG